MTNKKQILKKIIIMMLILCSVCAGCVFSAGRTSGLFTLMGTGSAPIGMAEAYTSLVRGCDSIQYNPAGAFIENAEIGAVVQQGYFGDGLGSVKIGIREKGLSEFADGAKMFATAVYVADFACAAPGFLPVLPFFAAFSPKEYSEDPQDKVMDRDAMSLSFETFYYTAGNIELIDIDGNKRTVSAERDFMAVFNVAFRVPGRFSKDVFIGSNFKAFYSELVEEYSGVKWLWDSGVILDGIGQSPFSAGISMQNVYNNKIRYKDDKNLLPRKIRMGVSYKTQIKGRILTPSIDTIIAEGEDKQFNAGIEVQFNKILAIRCGYKFVSDTDGFSAGFGIKWENIKIDYGTNITKDSELMPHRLSIKYLY